MKLIGSCKVAFIFLVLTAFSTASAQEKGKLNLLPENASIEQTREWLTSAIKKYAKYKTRTRDVGVSNIAFSGCTLNYELLVKTTGSSTDTMGTTVRTSKENRTISIPFGEADPVRISTVEYLLPELRTVKIEFGHSDGNRSGKIEEIVVKIEAAEQIRNGFEQAARLCKTNH